MDLDRNEIHGSRVLSLGDLGAGVEVTARSNGFDFDEALLCINGLGPDDWRRSVIWHGQENRYRGSSDWLCIDGRSAGVGDLAAWQRTWGSEEQSLAQEARNTNPR